jgi:hypothetical protein
MVGVQVRSSLRDQHAHRDLLALTRRMQQTSEVLDLTAAGVACAVRERRYVEAESRCDAAEQAAAELYAVMQTLSARVRDARDARSAA